MIGRATKPTETEVRAEALTRSRGLCDLCDQPIVGSFEVHHIFFKSQFRAKGKLAVGDQFWNRAVLHHRCHQGGSYSAHVNSGARGVLEALAVYRLKQWLGPEKVKQVETLQEGETPKAFVTAYEKWHRLGVLA